MPRERMKIQMIRKIHVTVRTIQKSNMRSDKRNLCPRFAFVRYIEMCVTAPPMNIIMKTMVRGKSTVVFGGLPPRKPPLAGSIDPPDGGPLPSIFGAFAGVSAWEPSIAEPSIVVGSGEDPSPAVNGGEPEALAAWIVMTPCGPLLTTIFARAACATAMVNNTSLLSSYPGDVTGDTDIEGVGGSDGNDDEVRGDGKVGSPVITRLVVGALVWVVFGDVFVAKSAVFVTVVVSRLLCVPWTRQLVDRRLAAAKRW